MVFVIHNVHLLVTIMTLCVCMVSSINVMHTVNNSEQINYTWKNLPRLKNDTHLHLKRNPAVESDLTVYRHTRKLLHVGSGPTDHGFEDTSAMHKLPMPSNMVNRSVAVMGVGGSVNTNASDYKHVLMDLSVPGVVVDDLFIFHFLPGPENQTTLHRKRWVLAAADAANTLKELILKGVLFTPSIDPSPRLNADIDMLDILCDSTETSLAACEWNNQVLDGDVSEHSLDVVPLLHQFTSNSTETNPLDEWMMIPEIGSNYQDFIEHILFPSGKSMLFDPVMSSSKIDTSQNIDPLDELAPAIVWVALLSNSSV